jgi:hypothetical protein
MKRPFLDYAIQGRFFIVFTVHANMYESKLNDAWEQMFLNIDHGGNLLLQEDLSSILVRMFNSLSLRKNPLKSLKACKSVISLNVCAFKTKQSSKKSKVLKIQFRKINVFSTDLWKSPKILYDQLKWYNPCNWSPERCTIIVMFCKVVLNVDPHALWSLYNRRNNI